MSRQGIGRKIGTETAPASKPSGATAFAHGPGASAAATMAGVEVKAAPAAQDAIRKRAYELYVERIAKGQPGDAKTDWLKAEREAKK